MRKLAFILFLFAVAGMAAAGPTNYFCVTCGKGPLTNHMWISKWGPVCDECYKAENHCSLCGLPIVKDYVKTGDGRYICKFDKVNAVLDVEEAREVFTDARRGLVELFGSSFALEYPEVKVSLFDVDYWSESGKSDGMHKFGFSNTRKTRTGECTHEVVMLSGRLRNELGATAAHEYTHLWINENRPATHTIDPDTLEALCELSAYKLMESRSLPDEEQRILDNPYTHGVIKKMVALEQDRGIAYILNWVKTGTTPTLDTESVVLAAPVRRLTTTFTNMPVQLPATLKLGGLMLGGPGSEAIINGVAFAAGETKPVKLQNRTVQVSCMAIHRTEVILKVDGLPDPVSLGIGQEKYVP